ncbi:hypothetical protein APT65_00022 [Trabzonvirus APT65]|uniref:Tip attachment protein J central straight fiber domain-containing protein n=1 Tax=Aeromonas phage APT65 TaxID=2982914 RepID=A0A9E8GH06_9CAUD|nr:hypothetical protein APT65_00022 [Aeromonas phage APT65]
MNSRLFTKSYTVGSTSGEAPPPPDTPTNTSRDFGKILENVYKPGFIDQDTLENTKMAVDRELGEISKAFFQTTERTTDGIKRVDQIVIETDNLSARIEEVDQVSKAGDQALASRITTVETEYKAADADLSSAITTESTARSNADSALATQITTVDANYKAADVVINASITAESTARVNGDSALATQITTVKSELEGDIAAVQTYATTNINRIDNDVNAVEAKWGVRVNVNNKVTGIQLNNNGNQTSFSVQADQFIISDGTNNNGAPFEVVGGITKIKNAAVGTISSDNWNGSNIGWAITKDGYANFQNVIVRGNLSADTFTGVGGSGNTFSCASRPKVTTGQVITLDNFSISQALQQNSFILVNRPMIVLFGFGRVFLRLRRKDTNAIVASGYGMNYLSNINDGVSVTISLSGTLPAGYSGQLELEGYMDNSHGLGSGAWQADGGSNGDWTVYRAV